MTERRTSVVVATKPLHTGFGSPWGVSREWGSKCMRASPIKVPT